LSAMGPSTMPGAAAEIDGPKHWRIEVESAIGAPNSKPVAEIAPPQAPSMPFVQGNQVFADQNDDSWAFRRRPSLLIIETPPMPIREALAA
jgi:hypothetical protein